MLKYVIQSNHFLQKCGNVIYVSMKLCTQHIPKIIKQSQFNLTMQQKINFSPLSINHTLAGQLPQHSHYMPQWWMMYKYVLFQSMALYCFVKSYNKVVFVSLFITPPSTAVNDLCQFLPLPTTLYSLPILNHTITQMRKNHSNICRGLGLKCKMKTIHYT